MGEVCEAFGRTVNMMHTLFEDIFLGRDFLEGYEELWRFYLQESHINVPETENLGKWITKVREDYKSGLLDEGNVEKIESIPDWSWRKR